MEYLAVEPNAVGRFRWREGALNRIAEGLSDFPGDELSGVSAQGLDSRYFCGFFFEEEA